MEQSINSSRNDGKNRILGGLGGVKEEKKDWNPLHNIRSHLPMSPMHNFRKHYEDYHDNSLVSPESKIKLVKSM